MTDDDNSSTKWRRQIVWTNVANTSTIELRNLTSEVESKVLTNYGDEHNVEGDDEHEDNDGKCTRGSTERPRHLHPITSRST